MVLHFWYHVSIDENTHGENFRVSFEKMISKYIFFKIKYIWQKHGLISKKIRKLVPNQSIIWNNIHKLEKLRTCKI